MIPIDRKRCFIYQPVHILSRKPALVRKTTTINRAENKKKTTIPKDGGKQTNIPESRYIHIISGKDIKSKYIILAFSYCFFAP